MPADVRRLAAIVSADVAGYSRLMGRDESGTLRRLNAHRSELIDPLIDKHGGRIVKTTGDGLLLEFPSVVAAVECCVAVQEGMVERNPDADEDAIHFRIGVHLGDVIVEGDDIFGDGVNIAARVEGLAAEGGISITDDAYRQVRDRLDLAWEDEGSHEVKNIERPVQVWRWSSEAQETLSVATDDGEALALPDKPSIAVLPFDNMSSDPEHEYFADGIAEDIITALSKISRMRVIARNSTFVYKGKAHDLRQVATELGVRYVLEGSIRSGGKRLRITAQLIDATDGSHVWAERYDRTIDDIFDIQDEITKEIVTALRVNLTDGEEAAVLARGTNDIEAWQLCVRASELFMRFNAVDYLEARALAEKSVARDPNYAYAWAILGFTHWWDGRIGFTGSSEAKFARASEYAERALEIDDTLSFGNALSSMLAAVHHHHDDSVAIAQRGFKTDPGHADARAFLALALLFAGQHHEAEEHFRAAMLLNPFHPVWYRHGLSWALAIKGDFDEALTIANDVLRLEPTITNVWLIKALIFGQTGRPDEARRAVQEIRRMAPDLRLEHVPGILLVDNAVFMERLLEVLRQAGLPEE